jgi:hypothetical protein
MVIAMRQDPGYQARPFLPRTTGWPYDEAMRALWFIGGAVLGAGGMYYAQKKLKPLFGAAALPDAIKSAAGVHVRQIRRYAFASSQDKSPIVGLTHASYALILLDTLEEIIGREAILKAGYDPTKLRAFITKNQDKHAAALQGKDSFLSEMLAVERAESPTIAPGIVSGPWAAPRGA